ncbi:hypothetical protein SAMN06265365_11260 [Tistlia consotensis]|uniref:Uncharacterized protein n=1 Tax=Tistlia consotensis USBA 355 TaxID=560819 RepID=A0A1Y6BZC9_9PROT|nr:hypothetical protein [Tistlia consotensis]SMF36176.1 hypothetical protein SAMN05428998_11260 [Tistlia consotensis USBA 355]SNR71584.1 hypothetical protein SAMN06265365_11260 [Tistlia consotensis]
MNPDRATTNHEPWRDAPVPAAYQGLWRRLSLIRPDGTRDATTLVLWLQTPEHHADLRIPADRPDLTGAAGLDELDIPDLLALARQEGFAGGQQYRTGQLAWRRVIDFAPSDGPPDEGIMEATGPGRFTETGLHVAYGEDWLREDGAEGPFAARVERAPFPRFLLRAGRWVALAEDRRPAPPPPGGLVERAEAAAAAGDRQALRDLLDCPISFAEIGTDGIARIRHSSHPWLEGGRLPVP